MIHPSDFDAAPPPIEPTVSPTPVRRARPQNWLIVAIGSSIVLGMGWLVTAARLQDARNDQASLQVQLRAAQQDGNNARDEAARLKDRLAAIVPSLQASLRIETVECFRVDNDIQAATPADSFDAGIRHINLYFRGPNPLRDLSDFTTTVEIAVVKPDGTLQTFEDAGPVTATLSCVSSEATCSGGFGFIRPAEAPFESGTWQFVIERSGRRIGLKTFDVR